MAASVVAGAVLVAAAVGGARAASQLELEVQPLLSVPPLLDSVLLAVAALCLPVVVLGMLLHRRVRATGSEPPNEWLRRLVTLAVVVLALVVLRELLPGLDEGARVAETDRDAGALDISAALRWSGETAVLVVALSAVAATLLWWRARSGRLAGGPLPPAGDVTAAAIHAGRAAFDQPGDDPRDAVVACYAAMEDALAASGAPRGIAESPQELLARATAEGRVPAAPARRLTDLFLLARYSTAPISDDDVAAGRAALQAIDRGALR
ncbi:MAG: DUF4129 domain-containing protein [Jiangellaceae bacterium]|nr:DUF4129 domain-containing protein [Jiangellaceae bacterium]